MYSFLSRTYGSVARECGVSGCVVQRACENFRAHGVCTRYSKVGRPRQFPPEVLEAMVSSEALKRMAFLSLKQRTELLYKTHGVSISPKGLSSLYRRHSIDYRFARPQCRHIIADTYLQTVERKEAAFELLNLMASKEPVVFVDECSLNVSLLNVFIHFSLSNVFLFVL